MASLVGMRFDMKIIPTKDETSCINFFTTEGDTAFCFNPQPDENKIVCNTKIGGSWGAEETCSGNKIFQIGKPVLVFIDFREDGWFPVCGDDSSVSIKYKHRIDVSKVTQVNFTDMNIESLTISPIPK